MTKEPGDDPTPKGESDDDHPSSNSTPDAVMPSAPGPDLPPQDAIDDRPPLNQMAVATLVTGILGMGCLTVIFAFVASRQLDRGGGRGRGHVTGGLAALAAWVIVALIVGFAVQNRPAEDSAPAFNPSLGDCLDWNGQRLDSRVVPCGDPHGAEVALVFSLPEGPWPGAERAEARSQAECRERVLRRYGTRAPIVNGQAYAVPPTSAGWEGGDRRVHCVVAAVPGSTLAGRLPDGDTGFRLWGELRRADCFTASLEKKPAGARLVDCDRRHDGQVTHVFELPGEAFPGVREVEKLAGDGCTRELRLVEEPQADLRLTHVTPTRDGWYQNDQRTVVCLALADGEELTESVVRPE
ncbi:septum formation family protein [Thermomonospora umbrina]|uniref:Putative regulator of septum formation n=1 Tax=Thermomonospora umbrina TaxID=111806 RepID=A0A3D9STP0_9ACTN|nr:septum formation family protein [Thermomonospora umbrina]REE99329.1 putative regulator of septum formation [Thermomonospora umbrina]